MKNEIIDRKLKAAINFFNISSVFIIGLATGDLNLYFKYLSEKNITILYIFIAGIVVLVITFVVFIRFFFSIKKLIKNKNL